MSESFKISVMISGSGTTLKNLIEKKSAGQLVPEIVQVISSKPDATGIAFAKQASIPVDVLDHRKFDGCESLSNAIFEAVRNSGANLVVLGGFLRKLKIPTDFENRVVNIHPSLIPAFCGKGFYGSHVHQGVIDYGCKISGCTVHYVDDQFDHGPIIAQQPVPVMHDDTAKSLAERVFAQECELYPKTINLLARGRIRLNGRIVEVA